MPVQQSFLFSSSKPHQPARRNLVIEAGAGTGKTTAIVGEVLNLLLSHPDLDPERIVLMTFTEKAAGEIADRIHEALIDLELRFDEEHVQWPAGSSSPLLVVPPERREDYRRACRRQVERIDSIRSQTIHSFCQSLLRAHPLEAGLDPQFRIVEGFERSLLYGQLYDAWLDHETRAHPTPQILLEWELLIAHVGYLFQIRELILGLLPYRELLDEAGYDFGRLEDIEPDLRLALDLIRGATGRKEGDQAASIIFRYVRQTETPSRGSLDGWIDYFAPLVNPLRQAKLPADPELKRALIILRTDNKKSSTTIYDRLIRHRSAHALLSLGRRFIAFAQEEKRKLGVVDFDDLLLYARDLLNDPLVLRRVRQQVDYLFVDEFQDTDRVQAEIIEKIAGDEEGRWVEGKMVIVGDPKQSIYGFRGADPQTYRSMATRMIDGGAEHRLLPDQYRSEPELLEVINDLFARVFQNAGSDANVFRPPYRPLRSGKRPGRPLDPPLTLLATSSDDPQQRYLSEAEAIARWIGEHRLGHERDLQRFAILFRRLTRIDDYLEVFDRHHLDYVLPQTKAFLDRRAPVDLVAVLRAIAFPFDRGARVSAARTPYFALTDEEIALGLLSEEPEQSGAWSRFNTALDAYRRESVQRTVSGTIDLLVESAGIERIYRNTVEGHRALRHLEHLRGLAFEYDRKMAGSIRHFVEEIDRRRSEPEEVEPSLADDDSNALRILSVHAAKGLEFDTVILPDLAFRTRGGEGLQLLAVEEPKTLVMNGRAQSLNAHFRFTAAGERLKSIAAEREEAEMRRLFYVAVTRARSEVVLACPPLFRKDGFLGVLAEALGFDRESYASLWPGDGKHVTPMRIGTREHRIAFVRYPEQESKLGARRGRLRSASLEQQLTGGTLVEPGIVPPPPAPRLEDAQALIARARSRNRSSGILLHRLLERWSLREEELDPLLEKLALESAAGERAVERVRLRIRRLRDSPAFQRVARAQTVGRELPVRFRDEEGRVVERRIDRLLREERGEIVLDYKSGAPAADRLPGDEEQVVRYCQALQAMTGRPCLGMLWYIDDDTDVLREVVSPAVSPVLY